MLYNPVIAYRRFDWSVEDVVALSQTGMTLHNDYLLNSREKYTIFRRVLVHPKRKLHQSPGEASVDSDLAKFGKPLQKGSRRRGRPAAGWRAGQG